MSWLADNSSMLAALTFRHMWLSAIPILLGFALALPVGWVAHRVRPLRGVLLSAGSLLYTIPSLPLFVILPSILGLGYLSVVNAIAALTIYAFAIMVRSVTDALDAVSDDVLNAATALGFSPTQKALRVTLPLAGPVMLATLRVVAVSTVSLLSVAALIGIRNLGSLFTDGFQRRFIEEIVVGIVLTVLVAFVFDRLIVLAGRLLLPWTAAVRSVTEHAHTGATP